MSRRTSLLMALVGAALLVGAPVAWLLGQPADTVGEVPVAAPAEPAPAPAPPVEDGFGADDEDAGRRAADASSTDAAVDDAAVDETSAPEVRAPLRALDPPTSIRIDALGVDAPVVPVGLEPDGAMEIPHEVSTVGWYELGVRPGEQGTAVLSGHVDSRTQGRGAFFDLRHLDVDDLVTVADDEGEEQTWRVVGRTTYPKDELPIEDIFTRFGDTRLVLITCGGPFDSDTRHYTENVVVYTEPVDA